MAPTTDPTLTLSSSQARAVHAAIQQWLDQRLISSSLASQLLSTLDVEDSFDWQRFAKYTFRLAVICLTIALVSILADDAFMKLLKRIFSIPAWLRGLLTAAVAVGVHWWGYQRQIEMPFQIWMNESVHALGGLVAGLAALQLAEVLGVLDEHQSNSYGGDISKEEKEKQKKERVEKEKKKTKICLRILLLLAGTYSTTGLVTRSNLIWSSGMIVLGTWLGAVTGYLSGSGAYFFGMSYPSRFVAFGLGLVGAGYEMRRWDATAPLRSSTRIWGLLYLFIALWSLSIFGDDQLFSDGKREWAPARQGRIRLFIWSLLFGLAAGYCVVHGMNYQDGTLKGFGLTFLGINLYTKFFEVFWSRWHKPIFFAVLAGTLAIVGRYAERMWNLQLQQ